MGGARGGPPPLIFRPRGPKGRKCFLRPAPPLSQGLDDCPPPPLRLSEGLDPPLCRGGALRDDTKNGCVAD